jgi:diguanylate cyclase (GGDEF)-like protein
VLPFAIIRYLQGQWVPAIIDTIIVLGFAILGLHVYRTRRTRFASYALAMFCIIGVLSTVYMIGAHQVYWAYPALMAVFYLVPARVALLYAFALLAALGPSLVELADSHATSTILVTLAVMSAFGFSFSLINHRQQEKLMQLATKDPLTGAGNRRRLNSKMSEIVSARQRNGTLASMLLLDLDHFKAVNDAHGHAVGDQILKSVTEIVNLRIRVTDSLYRVGGEEFVVVLEGQGLQSAMRLAEQLRTLVEANELAPDQSVTVSIGISELRDDETAASWLQRADEALYCAKDAGRNATRAAA